MVNIALNLVEKIKCHLKEWIGCFETPIGGVICTFAVRLRRQMDRLVPESAQPVEWNSVSHSSVHQAVTQIISTQYGKLFHNAHDKFGFRM